MTVCCGVHFPARLQTVSYCDTTDGEVHQRDLHHQTDDIRSSDSHLQGEVVIGLEASAYSAWVEQMLEERGLCQEHTLRAMTWVRFSSSLPCVCGWCGRECEALMPSLNNQTVSCVHRQCWPRTWPQGAPLSIVIR